MKTIVLTNEEADSIVRAIEVVAFADGQLPDDKLGRLADRIRSTPTTESIHPRKWSRRTGFRTWSKMGGSK